MKKNLGLRSILLLTLVTFLVCGCSKATEDATPAEESSVVSTAESTEESVGDIAEETETQEEAALTEEDVPAEESAEEEISEEPAGETYNGMPVAQVVTTVSNMDEFFNYVKTINEPSLLVYNENEGYVVRVEEGAYYQLLNEEKIFLNLTEEAPYYSASIDDNGLGIVLSKNIFEIKPDYSQFDKPNKVIFKVYYTEELQNGDSFKLTCYLDAPVE